VKPIDGKNTLKDGNVIVEVEVDPTPVIVYGVLADLLVLLPIIIMVSVSNELGYASYHTAMVNMMVIGWMPYGIVWIGAIAADDAEVRTALKETLSMSMLGPNMLQWIGYFSFLMLANDAE
jgi:hypothetical protein